MNAIVLKNQTPEGTPLEATFLPSKGMTLISYRKGNIEIIDQSTKDNFEKTHEGLGPVIGPHFHRRNPKIIPPIANESAFPHIALFKERGVEEPFVHGVGRYAPWQAETQETSIRAILTGEEMWRETRLSSIEGQNFKMQYDVDLTPEGLQLSLSVISEADSVVGIHFYYHLPNGTGKVMAKVKDTILDNLEHHNEQVPIPKDWNFDSHQQLIFDLNHPADYTFHPFPNPLQGEILLDTGSYRLQTTYSSDSEESSWQLWHPKGASFVCIEPISAQNPRRANLTVSGVRIGLKIL